MSDAATVDFESRSACSIRKCGSWRYSADPTTDILCLAYRLPYWPDGKTGLWHPAIPALGLAEVSDDDQQELMWWVLSGQLVEAHNAMFERAIWTNILTPRYGWPLLPHESWRCSAAKAASFALPRGLEGAGEALHLKVLKDVEGAKAMKKMMKPRKPRKKEREEWIAKYGQTPMPLLWHESIDLFTTLCLYCRQDVLAEEAISHALDDLSPTETQLYLLDQRMNEVGFRIDRPAVVSALEIIQAETDGLNADLCALTGGSPSKATQRAKMLEWFEQHGLKLFDTQKATIAEVVEDDDSIEHELADDDELPPWVEPATKLEPQVRQALEILQKLSLSSTAKYRKMLDWLCPDGRVHGGLLYHGATTGRWSGAGVQPHNFPKGCLKEDKHPMTGVWADLLAGSIDDAERKYSVGILKLLSHALRGAITASPGKVLYVADYAAIEARVLLWLAEDEDHLDLFRRGADLYLDMATKIYNYPCTKDNNPKERGLGKVAILGLGYQMGPSKFVDSAKLMGGVEIDEEFSKVVVETYRNEYWKVKSLWYEYERAAIAAVENPGEPQSAGRVVYVIEDARFLFCYLPSGRHLSYPYPEIHDKKTPWGAVKPSLTYMGVDQYTRKWKRQTSYGGLLVENATQAVARDIMAEAMLRMAQTKVYTPILSVHDEVIAEGHPRLGSVREFEAILTELPEWADGCPIAAEGWAGFRYHK